MVESIECLYPKIHLHTLFDSEGLRECAVHVPEGGALESVPSNSRRSGRRQLEAGRARKEDRANRPRNQCIARLRWTGQRHTGIRAELERLRAAGNGERLTRLVAVEALQLPPSEECLNHAIVRRHEMLALSERQLV